MFSVFESTKVHGAPGEGNTMQEAWKVILWSMWHLWLGKWPEADWLNRPWPAGSAESRLAGQDLAGGYFCVPWLLKGDLDFFAKCLGL
jgi:hypothetical protein